MLYEVITKPAFRHTVLTLERLVFRPMAAVFRKNYPFIAAFFIISKIASVPSERVSSHIRSA